MNGGLPPSTVRTCGECPWRRESAPGWLGPFNTDDWLALVHSDAPIACHETVVYDDDDWAEPHLRQCAGAAQYRRNVAKRPVDHEVAVADEPDTVAVFATPAEFRQHHDRMAS